MISKYKLKQWQNELKALREKTGISFEDVSNYLDVSYNRDIGFYVKLPMKRKTFIGIGMVYGLPLDEINRWITKYGMKRRLYSKDISEDLVWIYLINANYEEAQKLGVSGDDSYRHRTNFYREYDRCQALAFDTYLAFWSAIISDDPETADVEKKLKELDYGEDLESLKTFVEDNIDAFKTAYAKPRRVLRRYVDCILEINGRNAADSLSSLRGWLDDSMINFLAGSPDTINIIDRWSGVTKPKLKSVPKIRKTHISLALALGMTTAEISNYLELLGFAPLDEDDADEGTLIRMLDKWDAEHPLQRRLKETRLEDPSADGSADGSGKPVMDPEDQQQAVSDMLALRQELQAMYEQNKMKFPYIKH